MVYEHLIGECPWHNERQYVPGRAFEKAAENLPGREPDNIILQNEGVS